MKLKCACLPPPPLFSPGCVSAPHPAAAHGGRCRRQFFQRAAGTGSHHRRSNKGAHQPDIPGGAEVCLRVYFPVSVNRPPPTHCRHLIVVSSRRVQDVCAPCSGVRRSQHWPPNKGTLEGLQRAVRNPRETAGYDWTRKGSVASGHPKCPPSAVSV